MSHWDNQAKQWDNITEPLRPSVIDIQNLTNWIHHLYKKNHKPLTVLLLGVTPEIVRVPWPAGTRLLAVDKNMTMIESLFPRMTPYIKPYAIAANWLQLPLKPGSFDVIIGDGCYNSLAFSEYAVLTKAIKSLLKNNGLLMSRFFLRPNFNESLDNLKQSIIKQEINNFSTFKLRLLMALHHDLNKGVCLNETWHCWDQEFKNLVCSLKCWTDGAMNVINNYKDKLIYYTFPTLGELKNHFKMHLAEQEVFIPDYQLGECCPTFRWML